MQDAAVGEALRQKYYDLLDDLDERGRRRWAATEARALGRGGIAAVARATGLSDRTIRTGLAELREPLTRQRQRKPGGGRKPATATQPDLLAALDHLIEPRRSARRRTRCVGRSRAPTLGPTNCGRRATR